MITTPQALLRELQARGLVDTATQDDGDAHLVPSRIAYRPWYVSGLLGISGWLAGLFLLGFVALLVRPTTSPAAAMTGLFVLAAAWGLFKADRDGEFTEQFALALSIAGQCLLLFAMSEDAYELGSIAASALGLQLVLALVMPNRLHRGLSAFFATIAWALTLRCALFGVPAFWRDDGMIAVPLGASLGGWLLVWLPVGAAVTLLIRHEAGWIARGWPAVVRPVLVGLIAGLGFATLISQPFESFRWFGGSAGLLAPNGLALWPLLSALAALGGAAAAFAMRSRALVGACVLAALLHVSHFYYAFGTGLLPKSLLMLAMGGAMWLGSRALARPARRGEGA